MKKKINNHKITILYILIALAIVNLIMVVLSQNEINILGGKVLELELNSPEVDYLSSDIGTNNSAFNYSSNPSYLYPEIQIINCSYLKGQEIDVDLYYPKYSIETTIKEVCRLVDWSVKYKETNETRWRLK